ncbi:MAG: membrane protein insertion efficiency factor YidD [Candidatus Angelobacter sp.]
MKNVAASCLRFYKGAISPFLPVACRFVPSCSEYAAEAVAKHGLLHGSALGLWRLLRCNPFARGGYDPVPSEGSPAGPVAAERLDAEQKR